MNPTTVRKLVYAALCLCLGLAMPWIFHLFGAVSGQIFLPMHIPVLLCGFICGPLWGAAVGVIAPLLRSVLFQSPPMFPVAISMAFELAVYGVATGIIYKLLPKKFSYIYVTLIASMIIGRVAGGIAQFALLGFDPAKFSHPMFFSAYFVGALPGIILHIALIPPIVWTLRRFKLTVNENTDT